MGTTDRAVVCNLKWKDPRALEWLWWALLGTAIRQVTGYLARFHAVRVQAPLIEHRDRSVC